MPGGLGRPVWVDDPHFNLDYHVRHTALPPPGSEADLDTLMGRLMSQELDRHRPLWEAWMVEGLTDGRWAIISKVHHCMVDGVSGTELMTSLLDPSRDVPRRVPRNGRRRPSRATSCWSSTRSARWSGTRPSRCAPCGRSCGRRDEPRARCARRSTAAVCRSPSWYLARRCRSRAPSARTDGGLRRTPSSLTSRRSRGRSAARSTTSSWP